MNYWLEHKQASSRLNNTGFLAACNAKFNVLQTLKTCDNETSSKCSKCNYYYYTTTVLRPFVTATQIENLRHSEVKQQTTHTFLLIKKFLLKSYLTNATLNLQDGPTNGDTVFWFVHDFKKP